MLGFRGAIDWITKALIKIQPTEVRALVKVQRYSSFNSINFIRKEKNPRYNNNNNSDDQLFSAFMLVRSD